MQQAVPGAELTDPVAIWLLLPLTSTMMIPTLPLMLVLMWMLFPLLGLIVWILKCSVLMLLLRPLASALTQASLLGFLCCLQRELRWQLAQVALQ